MPDAPGSARDAILDRIRETNTSVTGATCDADYDAISREYQQSSSMDRGAILKIFTERLHEYDAHVCRVTVATLPATIHDALNVPNLSVVVTNDFPQQWMPEGINRRSESDVDIEALNSTGCVVTTCEIAIAHTGTIIIRNSRRATLLPDRLLCVIPENKIVETVPEAISHLQPFAADALTFISGPSATSDIEMTRIRGVHGPRFLDVILVKEE